MADTERIAFASLIFLALIIQPGFCSWSQSLIVSVADQNGLPVPGAGVKITYQKANGITGNDGIVDGKTGEDGNCIATITNTVPKEMEDTRIRVTANAYGWQGETQAITGENNSGTKAVSFVAPFKLKNITVTVLHANGTPAAGASIYMAGSEMRTAADPSGKAVIRLPEGANASGFASYGNEGAYFTSSAAADDGRGELVVKFPGIGTGAAASSSTTLSVKFISTGNTSLAGEKIVFSYDGTDVSAYADAGGRASIDVNRNCTVIASVKKNDYNYSFEFSVIADGSPKNETAVLAPLLKIDYFESAPDGPGCYKLSAKASDPRLNKPISVRMAQVKNDGTPAGEIRLALGENGTYAGRACAGQGMSAKVIASNAYETVEKTIPLSQAGAQEPPASEPQPPNATAPAILPKPVADAPPFEGLGAIFAGIAILAMIFGAAVIALGRANPQATGGMAKYLTHAWGILAGSAVRPIVEYLRSLIRKREPPPISSFGQQPQG